MAGSCIGAVLCITPELCVILAAAGVKVNEDVEMLPVESGASSSSELDEGATQPVWPWR